MDETQGKVYKKFPDGENLPLLKYVEFPFPFISSPFFSTMVLFGMDPNNLPVVTSDGSLEALEAQYDTVKSVSRTG